MSGAVYLNALGLVCALGRGHEAVRAGLFALAASGVASNTTIWPGRCLPLGAVQGPLPDLELLPLNQRSRNNALLLAALPQVQQAVEAAKSRYGPHRVATVLGTSTSGVGESEAAIARWQLDGQLPAGYQIGQHEIGSSALTLAQRLGLGGPRYVVSTACSSSAKALASAARLLRAGQCDAVLTGGADALCRFTVAGFDALESLAEGRCNPMSLHRKGINIGEAATLFVMTREPSGVRLSGWGESSDAHHISAPDPSGSGALSAMRQALARAGLNPPDIDYLNLHGTATRQNDQVESLAVATLFGTELACSSTKPLTGHTLGAAGALEAALCWLTLQDNARGQLPVHWWDEQADPELPSLALVRPGHALGRPARHVMSNSFAFGGSNAALVLSRCDD